MPLRNSRFTIHNSQIGKQLELAFAGLLLSVVLLAVVLAKFIPPREPAIGRQP